MRLEFTADMMMLDVPITEVTDHTQKEPSSVWWSGGKRDSGVCILRPCRVVRVRRNERNQGNRSGRERKSGPSY